MNTDLTPALRINGWERALNAEVQAALARPFDWGTFDCCMFAANCVQAVTGVDIAATFRGAYGSRGGALMLIEAEGGLEAMIAGACTRHGLTERPPLQAHRGDVVLLPGRDGFASTAGICLGTKAAAPAPDGGLSFIPMTDALRVWHIEHASKCPPSFQP